MSITHHRAAGVNYFSLVFHYFLKKYYYLSNNFEDFHLNKHLLSHYLSSNEVTQ